MLTKDLLNTTNTQISISIKPLNKEVTVVDIVNLLRQLKNNQFMNFDDGISEAVKCFKNMTNDAPTPPHKEIVIAKAVDAILLLDVSDDDMLVTATVTSSWGGNDLSKSDLIAKLAEQEITYGLASDQFDKHIRFANFQDAGKTYSFEVAAGIPATHGIDSTFTRIIKTFEERELTPQESSNGKVDMHNLGQIQTVAIDTVLVTRTPATKGVNGMNVYGNEVATQDGNNIPFTINLGTKISPDDDNILISTLNGIPFLQDGYIGINDVLTIDTVDVNMGNIDFIGDVIVKGNIHEGMTVISQGNISVEGGISSATLQADGDIIIKNGVQGKVQEEDKKLACHITAGGSVSAQYIQYSNVKAGNNITVETQLLHCQVQAGDSVIVENSSQNKGTIFGGKIEAVNTISTIELGAHGGSKTYLKINGKLASSRKEIIVNKNSLSQDLPVLQKLIAAHEKVSLIKSKQQQHELLAKLKHKIDQKVATIVEAKKNIAHFTTQIDNIQQQMSIIVKGTVYDGVHVAIDKYDSQALAQYKAIKVSLKNNEITFSPLNEKN